MKWSSMKRLAPWKTSDTQQIGDRASASRYPEVHKRSRRAGPRNSTGLRAPGWPHSGFVLKDSPLIGRASIVARAVPRSIETLKPATRPCWWVSALEGHSPSETEPDWPKSERWPGASVMHVVDKDRGPIFEELLAEYDSIRAKARHRDLSDQKDELEALARDMGEAVLDGAPRGGPTWLTAARSLIDHGPYPHVCVPVLADLIREAVAGGSQDNIALSTPSSPQVAVLQDVLMSLAVWRSPGSWGDLRHLRAKERITSNVVAAKQLLKLAGIATESATGADVERDGGASYSVAQAFDSVFYAYGRRGEPHPAQRLADVLRQALRSYESLAGGAQVVAPPSAGSFDIEGAMVRALRPAFQSAAPTREREVQDAVEVILRAVGVEYSREKESASVGVRGFMPDFVIASEDLAIEIKLATQKHPVGDVQEEIATDVAAYSTKWKRILFIVYDLGVISHPDRMREDNMRKFGVNVLIIKH